nr:2-oxoglutarate dehydrogenase, mitochondrial-like [Tanacetum cinerariifolium]
MSPDESNARSLDSAPDSSVSAEAQESKYSNFVDQNVDRLEVNHEAILEPSMTDLSQVGSHDNLPGFNMLPQLAPINIEESLPLPPLPPMQWRMGKLQNTSMSTTMPDGGLHGFKIEEVAERIVPQPPSDAELSVNTKKVAERIVPQLPSDKERPVYVFLTEHEIIRPSSSLPLVDNERPNGIRPMKIQRPGTPLIDVVAAHNKSKVIRNHHSALEIYQKKLLETWNGYGYGNSDVVVEIICYHRLGHNEIDEPLFTEPKMYKVIRNHPSALEIYQKKLLETGQATKEDIDWMQNKVTSILNDEFLASKDYATSKMDWLLDMAKPEILKNVKKAIATLPETSKPHKAVKKVMMIIVSDKYILACDFVTFVVKPRYYDFFMRGLMLVHHYWPIKEDDKCRSILQLIGATSQTKDPLTLKIPKSVQLTSDNLHPSVSSRCREDMTAVQQSSPQKVVSTTSSMQWKPLEIQDFPFQSYQKMESS